MKKIALTGQQVFFQICLKVNTKSLQDKETYSIGNSLDSINIRIFNFYADNTKIETTDGQISSTPVFKGVSSYYKYEFSNPTSPSITFKINGTGQSAYTGPFNYDQIAVFIYQDNKDVKFLYKYDMHANPIDVAQIYEDDTLWRVIPIPPLGPDSFPNISTISDGCKGCSAITRMFNYTDTEFYADSGSFKQKYTQSSVILSKAVTFDIELDHWGIYTNVIFKENNKDYELIKFTDVEPDYFWQPLMTVGQLILLAMATRYIHLCCKKRKEAKHNFEDLEEKFLKNELLIRDLENKVKATSTGVVNPSPPIKRERLQALDTFRGLTIFMMVFVNYQGGNYEFFNHSLWNGLTLADVIFPFFMWIMGVSCAQAMKRAHKNKKWDMMKGILIRSLKLFQLGILVNQNWDMKTFRIMGVLQRFALSYLFNCALIIYLPIHHKMHIFKYHNYWLRIMFALVLPVTNILVTYQTKYKNCPSGYTGPGGLSLGPEYGHCIGGMNLGIDESIFTEGHIYQTPTAQVIYKSLAYDPEGLLGSFNSTFLTFFGLIVGETLVVCEDTAKRSYFLQGTGLVLILGGLGLSGFTMVDGIMPICKNLWSFSYVLFCAGLANLVFWLCLFLEKINWWLGWPFGYLGLNAILVYCGHELLTGKFPFGFDTSGRHFPAIFSSSLGVLLWTILAYYWFTIKWFVKV